MVQLTELTAEEQMEIDEASKKESVITTTDRIRIFRRPFAHILSNSQVNNYCSECFKKPEVLGKLMTCGGCSFARYCSKECQKMAWRLHKDECERLKTVFPRLPLTEVMFLSRVLDRKHYIEENGDQGWQTERKFTDLIGHNNEVKEDKERMERFKKLFEKVCTFRTESLSELEIFDLYCKTTINSHTVASLQGEEVGLSLDLGVSRYDHSCRPNCSMMFDGYYVYVRPLTVEVDPEDYVKSTISYTDVGRSRYQRRKELKSKWYFECHCERCEDPSDDLITSIRCKNVLCDEPIPISEDMTPKPVECPKCKTVADFEYVVRGQQTMLELPVRYAPDEKIEKLKEYLERARPILHEKNVYLTRLETAILHLSGKLGDNIASMYSKVQQGFSACFPTTEASKTFDLVERCAELIKAGNKADAAPIAFDAMCLLEASHGLSHPNYLKILALWTFLDKKAEKTDEELLALCEMDQTKDVKQVDLSEVLKGVSVNGN